VTVEPSERSAGDGSRNAGCAAERAVSTAASSGLGLGPTGPAATPTPPISRAGRVKHTEHVASRSSRCAAPAQRSLSVPRRAPRAWATALVHPQPPEVDNRKSTQQRPDKSRRVRAGILIRPANGYAGYMPRVTLPLAHAASRSGRRQACFSRYGTSRHLHQTPARRPPGHPPGVRWAKSRTASSLSQSGEDRPGQPTGLLHRRTVALVPVPLKQPCAAPGSARGVRPVPDADARHCTQRSR